MSCSKKNGPFTCSKFGENLAVKLVPGRLFSSEEAQAPEKIATRLKTMRRAKARDGFNELPQLRRPKRTSEILQSNCNYMY